MGKYCFFSISFILSILCTILNDCLTQKLTQKLMDFETQITILSFTEFTI